jgi:hypothetical protein
MTTLSPNARGIMEQLRANYHADWLPPIRDWAFEVSQGAADELTSAGLVELALDKWVLTPAGHLWVMTKPIVKAASRPAK